MTQDAKKKTIIFDMDGTLVETDAANNAAYRAALAANGVSVHGGRQGGFRGRVTAHVVKAAAGFGVGEMNAIAQAKIEAYRRELWRTRLGPAAEALKRALANRSAFSKFVLLTDGNERRTWETLRHWNLARHFDEVVCNGGRGDKYANYFGSHDSDPAACVVWENEIEKIASALAAGVKMENVRKVG